ncbi:MAG: hypothetical protein V1748_10010 [Actinomycetota bacterium]
MRSRHGQVRKAPGTAGVPAAKEMERTEPASTTRRVAKDISWVTAITVGIQLALDVIRVIREAADLKRTLFPARAGIE